MRELADSDEETGLADSEREKDLADEEENDQADEEEKDLADYEKETILLISGTNTAYQAKAVLRMLTSFVMLGSSEAREVLLRANWSHDNWDTLYKRTSNMVCSFF